MYISLEPAHRVPNTTRFHQQLVAWKKPKLSHHIMGMSWIIEFPYLSEVIFLDSNPINLQAHLQLLLSFSTLLALRACLRQPLHRPRATSPKDSTKSSSFRFMKAS